MQDVLVSYLVYGLEMMVQLIIYNKMGKKCGGLEERRIMKVQLLSTFFFGQRSGDSIHGNWADVPLGKYRGHGEITLVCSQNVHNYILTKIDSTGGFSGSVWEKYR